MYVPTDFNSSDANGEFCGGLFRLLRNLLITDVAVVADKSDYASETELHVGSPFSFLADRADNGRCHIRPQAVSG